MPTMTCPQCGHQNPVTANFCSSCGAELDKPDNTSSTTMTVATPGEAPAEEVHVELDDLPPGVGM
ncbi:MAG: zinc-ribbon domain-containing protein, partial [Microthrixaceae bacterium]